MKKIVYILFLNFIINECGAQTINNLKLDTNSRKFSVRAYGSSFFSNNSLISNDLKKYTSDEILNEIEKNTIINSIKSNFQFGFGYNFGSEIGLKINRFNYIFGYEKRFAFGSNTSSTMIDLLLNGNKKFENSTLNAGQNEAYLLQYSKVKFGIYNQFFSKKLIIKPCLSVYFPSRLMNYQVIDFRLNTGSDGEYLNANIDFLYQNSNQGIGAGIDLSANYYINFKSRLAVSIQDLGLVQMNNTKTIQSKGYQTFNGIEIGDISNLSSNTFQALGSLTIDSISGLKTNYQNQTFALPVNFQLAYNLNINKVETELGAWYQSKVYFKNLYYFKTNYLIKNNLKIGSSIAYGGYTSVSNNLFLDINLKQKHIFSVQSNYLGSILFPKISNSQTVNVSYKLNL